MAKKCVFCDGIGWQCGEEPDCGGGGGGEVTLGYICYKVVGGKRNGDYFADLIPVPVVAGGDEEAASAAQLLRPDFRQLLRLPEGVELRDLGVVLVRRAARESR